MDSVELLHEHVLNSFICILCMYLCVCACVHTDIKGWLKGYISRTIIWVSGIELRSLGLAASTFTHQSVTLVHEHCIDRRVFWFCYSKAKGIWLWLGWYLNKPGPKFMFFFDTCIILQRRNKYAKCLLKVDRQLDVYYLKHSQYFVPTGKLVKLTCRDKIQQ